MNKRFNTLLQLPDFLEFEIKKSTKIMQACALENPWFIQPFIEKSIDSWCETITSKGLTQLMKNYKKEVHKKIGIIAAGNIPLVGLHDLLVAYLYGCDIKIKLSSSDNILMKKVIEFLDPQGKAIDISEQLKEIDAVIATGSNNSYRYFEYYFRDLPKILRKNRTSVAILDGKENDHELAALANDIFLYFGMGCRNVSKVFVPNGYDLRTLFLAFESFQWMQDHHKFANNYMYHKAIWNMNLEPHWDNGFFLAKETLDLHAPLSCLFVEKYSKIEDLNLTSIKDNIQCTVSKQKKHTPFGKTQNPGLNTFADNIDTTQFLSSLTENQKN